MKIRHDSEGVIRAVDVYCKGNISLRTIEKLIPLEINEPLTIEDIRSNEEVTSATEPQGSRFHPQRASKVKAAIERRELIKQGLL